MSSDNYYVVRKNPKGGFSYVQGFASDEHNRSTEVFVDYPVSDISKVYDTYKECLEAALEDYSEYGVVTHPECEEADFSMRAEITEWLNGLRT